MRDGGDTLRQLCDHAEKPFDSPYCQGKRQCPPCNTEPLAGCLCISPRSSPSGWRPTRPRPRKSCSRSIRRKARRCGRESPAPPLAAGPSSNSPQAASRRRSAATFWSASIPRPAHPRRCSSSVATVTIRSLRRIHYRLPQGVRRAPPRPISVGNHRMVPCRGPCVIWSGTSSARRRTRQRADVTHLTDNPRTAFLHRSASR